MSKSIVLSLAAMVLIPGCTSQVQHSAPTVASVGMPLGAVGKIRDWRAEGTTGIYIESEGRSWYHATFVAPCPDLSFAGHIDFRTLPPFPIDRFDSIQVGDVVCYFKTLDEVRAPADAAAPKPAT